jgi:hypothetical protein
MKKDRQLIELARVGLSSAMIAEHMNVSPEAVPEAARRLGINPGRHRKSETVG